MLALAMPSVKELDKVLRLRLSTNGAQEGLD